MLADAVHLVDGRTGAKQRLVDGLLLFQRDAFSRHRQQRRRTARHQAQHEVVFRQALREFGDALRGAAAGFVGHRVRGLDDLDAARALAL